MHRPGAQLSRLDLNLLVALRELLRERNVTRAAQRIGVTQPAASASLARLRRHFGDELLVRSRGAGGYALSPLAAELVEQVEEVCARAERLFATGTEFEAGTSGHAFTLLATEYPIAVLGPQLSRLLESTAPRVTLQIRLAQQWPPAGVAETFLHLDGVIAPPGELSPMPGTRSLRVLEDRWVCVVSAQNRLLDTDKPTLDDLARLTWVVTDEVSRTGEARSPMPKPLALLGIRPRVAVRVENATAVPHLVAGTDRIALTQERLATRLAGGLGLRVLEPPIPLEPVVESLWWHRDRDHDLAHAWLRRLVASAANGWSPAR